MEPLLKNAFLKIERAKQHIVELNLEIDKFLDNHRHIAFIEHDPEESSEVIKVRQDFDVPVGLSLVLGDVVHNLHSALDIAINEVENLTCGNMTRHTKFPIYETKQAFEAGINGGFRNKVPWEILNYLQVDIQPYAGGSGEALLKLHALDIEDKHRILLTTTHLVYVAGICVLLDDGTEFTLGDWLIVPDAVAKYKISGNRNLKIIDQGKAFYQIEFGGGLPFAGETIQPTCDVLVRFVTEVVQELNRIMGIWVQHHAMLR